MSLSLNDGPVAPLGTRVFRRAARVVFPLLLVLLLVAWLANHQFGEMVVEADFVWDGLDIVIVGLFVVLSMLVMVGGLIVAYLWEQRVTATCALEENQVLFDAFSSAVDCPIVVWTASGVYLDANPAFAALMGVSREELVGGGRVDGLATPPGREMAQFIASVNHGEREGGKERHDLTLVNTAGEQLRYVISLARFSRSGTDDVATLGIMADCTHQKAVEKDLLQIRAALDDSADAVLITDVSGTPTYINAVFGYWFGYTPDQIESIDLDRIYGGPGSFQELAAPLLEGENVSRDMVLSTYFERLFHVHLRGSAIVDEHFEIAGTLFLHTDVTEQKRLEAELEQLSRIDGLTGIHNRRSFDDRLAHEWRRARREQSRLSLIMLDIDAFKRYNDHYGHQEGDACLKQVAAGIAETFQRPGDFVARYGGEEFAVIIADEGDALTVAQAERLRAHIEAMALPHADSPTADVVTVSIGLATMTPDESDDMASLIQRADDALYRAKEEGRNRVCHSGVELS